jgi:hypothetical protein
MLSYDVAEDGSAAEYIGNGYRVHRSRARLLAEIENLPGDDAIKL